MNNEADIASLRDEVNSFKAVAPTDGVYRDRAALDRFLAALAAESKDSTFAEELAQSVYKTLHPQTPPSRPWQQTAESLVRLGDAGWLMGAPGDSWVWLKRPTSESLDDAPQVATVLPFQAVPDYEQAKRFQTRLDPNATLFTFQTYTDKVPAPKPDPLARVIQCDAGSFVKLEAPYARGSGVWLAVNETDGEGRKSENVRRFRAVWCEDDTDRATTRTFPVRPSMIVESSPGHRHNYWIVADKWPADEQGRAEHTGVMERMIADHGSDKSAKDASRVLRVPGYQHRKDPANPQMVRLLDDSGPNYTRAEILAHFPPLEGERTKSGDSTSTEQQRENEKDVLQIIAALEHVDPSDREVWLHVGMALKDHLPEKTARHLWDGWSAQPSQLGLYDPANSASVWKSIKGKDGGVKIGTLFHHAREGGWPRSSTADAAPTGETGSAHKITWLDMSNWDNDPVPKRQWAIVDRVPLNQAGLFSGEGGTGKSIVEIAKGVAHVIGGEWLGSFPVQGPAFYLGAEDEADELHIRLHAIAQHYGTTFEKLKAAGLYAASMLGQDATLCALNAKTGRVEVTALYHELYEMAGDIKPKNISIDTLSRAFAGNEIDRHQVYAFAMHMQALAKVAGGAVTVLSHPSLAGMASGSGISGSTAWHGAFRFRQYLKSVKDDESSASDLREFQFKKNQYGPLGESIVLRYQNGLFLPEGA
jgi:AAA domain/Primase C terminal 2 (PriCT-2)/RepB DNA-primase N-terminal domain